MSAEITCSKCHQLTNQLETTQMELKSLQLAVKLLQKDIEQRIAEPVVELRDTEYKNKPKDERNGVFKEIFNNISSLQDNILDYKGDIDGLISVLHTIKNRQIAEAIVKSQLLNLERRNAKLLL